MDKLILSLLKGLNFGSLVLILYRAGGRDALERFFTVPEKVVKQMPTAKLPGRIRVIVEERDEFVEEAMEFADACVDEDFVDPD